MVKKHQGQNYPIYYRPNEECHYIIKAVLGKVVKLTGCEMFETEYYDDTVYIYDGYESQKKVLNYISHYQSSHVFNHVSSGQIMEIVFKRLNNFKR